jgi:pimeloyl-ACP methyl ester carboxylesterase
MEHFDVIAYDRRGYQSSRDLKPFSLDLHIEDLLAVAASESKRGPVIFFGHSFGGLIALGASIANSASAQLVMCFEAPLPWVLSRDSSRPALGDDPAYEAEVFFRRMVSDGAWERLSEAERESRRLDGPGLFSDISLLRSGEVPFDLADLRVPTLYAHGDWAQKDYYRELSRVLPSLNPLISTYEVVNARHGAHLANPDQLAALIEETWSRQCE